MLQLAENMCQSACGGGNIGLGLSGASPRTVEQTKEASDFLYPQLGTHLLTHSLTYSPIHSLTHSLLLTYSLTLTRSLTHLLTHLLTHV
jgi:hypothetical protein